MQNIFLNYGIRFNSKVDRKLLQLLIPWLHVSQRAAVPSWDGRRGADSTDTPAPELGSLSWALSPLAVPPTSGQAPAVAAPLGPPLYWGGGKGEAGARGKKTQAAGERDAGRWGDTGSFLQHPKVPGSRG